MKIQEIIGKVVIGIGDLIGFKYDYEIMNESCQKVIDAISSKDCSALKALFSEKALMEAENFDQTASELFELFRGEVVSYYDPNGAPNMTGGADDGKWERVLSSGFNVETTEAQYHIVIDQTSRNDSHPEEIGITYIWIEPTNDLSDWSKWSNGDKKVPPGISLESFE